MIGFTLLVLVFVVMILGGLFLLPESLLAGLGTPGPGGGFDDPDDIVDMARAFESSEQYHEALSLWTQYIERTGDPNGYFRRALALQRLDRHDRAIDDLLTLDAMEDDLPDHYYLYRAKSWQAIEETEKALRDYGQYFDVGINNYEAMIEAAQFAAREGREDLAAEWLERVIDSADGSDRETARLELAEMALMDGDTARAGTLLDSLNESDLTEMQKRSYLFIRARMHEEQEEPEAAHELYRTLYDQDPTFRNVEQKIKEHSASISDDNLIHEFRILENQELAECCRNIVRIMGYEPMESNVLSNEEVNVVARDDSAQLMAMDQYLFSFKQWDGYIGVLALKEFELLLLEGRYDRGFFVAPRGFKPSAMEYAQDSPKMELIGPDALVTHLREIL